MYIYIYIPGHSPPQGLIRLTTSPLRRGWLSSNAILVSLIHVKFPLVFCSKESSKFHSSKDSIKEGLGMKAFVQCDLGAIDPREIPVSVLQTDEIVYKVGPRCRES